MKMFKRLFSLILTLAMLFTFASFPLPASAAVSGNVTIYPEYPDELPRDYDYEVTVTGANGSFTIPVYNATRNKNAYHDVENTDSWRRFCEFAFTGEVEIAIRVKVPMNNYALLPSSKGYSSSVSGNTIKFKLTQPQNLILRLNNDNNTILSIFAEAPETSVPSKNDPNVLYFDAGLNNLVNGTFELSEYGQYVIDGGKTVYLAPGALVTARFMTKRSNVTVCGRGAVIDPRTDRGEDNWTYLFWSRQHSYTPAGSNTTIYEEIPTNIVLKDVKFLDANTFNICFSNSKDVTVDNIKILSSAISTDGFSTWGNSNENINISNSFLYINDNAFVIGAGENNYNVKNCIVGTGHAIIHPQGTIKSATFDGIDLFEIGNFFRAAEEMKTDVTWNIKAKNFRGSDALSMSALIFVRDSANGTKNVTFENMSLPSSTPVVYSTSTTNMKFTFNNVYLDSTQLNSTSQFKSYQSYGHGSALTNNIFTFGSSFDSSAAGVGTYFKALKTANYAGDETIQIGGYTLPFSKQTVVNSGGVTYVNAMSVLEELYYNPNFNGTTLTFDGSSKYSSIPLKIIGGEAMLPISFFSDTLKHNVSYQDGVVKISPRDVNNLLINGGFENLDNPYLPNGINPIYSRDWTYFNFGGVYNSTDTHTGSGAAKLSSTADSARAMAQYITPQIKKYGAGTYRLEAWVKKGANSDVSNAFMGIIHSDYQAINGDVINDFKSFTLTNSWQKISYDIVVDDINADGYDRAFLVFGNEKGTGDVEFFIDDVSLSYGNKLIIYPEYPDEVRRDYDFAVKVTQGEKSYDIPVYNAARQNSSFSSNGDNYRRFSEFSFEGAVTVEVECRFGCGAYTVLPSSKGVTATKSGGVVKFTLTEPGNYYVRMNDDDNVALAIFADPVETEIPSENDPNVIYFKAGLNNSPDYKLDSAGRLRVDEGKTVYLEPGALVMARPYVMGSNAKIMGRGSFMDPKMDRNNDWSFMCGINNNINAAYDNNTFTNVTLQDVKILDAHGFNITIREVNGLHINNVKVLSNQISTDGISIWAPSGQDVENVLIENCFIYNSDDMNVYSQVKSITVRNCVFAASYRFLIPQNDIGTILFENIDIFKLETFLRASASGEAAKWDNITFRNIHVEDAVGGMNYFIRIQDGTSDTKNITFENVSLPAKFTNGVLISNTQGVNLTFNNVYVGGKELTSASTALSLFGKYSVCSGNTVKFGTSFDKNLAKAGSFQAVKGDKNWQGSMRVVIGEADTLAPAKVVPYTSGGVTYISAPDTLEALGYSSKLEGNTLTFTKGDSFKLSTSENAVYKNGVKIGEGRLQIVNNHPMVSLSLFQTLGYTVDTMTNNRIKILTPYMGENLIREGGFETNKNPFFTTSKLNGSDRIYSLAWNSFNFGEIASSTEAHTGSRSLHLNQTTAVNGGVAQPVGGALRKYGKTVYNITLYAKLGENSELNKDIYVGFVQGNYRIFGNDGNFLSTNVLKKFTLTDSWQKICFDVEVNDAMMAVRSNMYLYIGSAATAYSSSGYTFDCYIDDVSLSVITPVTQSTIADVINSSYTRDGAVQKAWANGNGWPQKLGGTFSGTIYLHPEFASLDEDMNGEVLGDSYINGLYLEGTQIRIGSGVKTGLRFVTVNNTDMVKKLQKEGITATYGTLVALASDVKGEMEIGDELVTNSVATKIYKSSSTLGTDYQKYTACVYNIGTKYFKTDITVRPYISYVDGSGITRVIYGEQYTCNLYEAAQLAYNSPDEPQANKDLIYSQILSKVN